MVNTIKSGMGLFQQLAFKNKLASERKENEMMTYNTKPAEYDQQTKEVYERFQEKNCFGTLIQNIQ